jgi:hypothetical protein
MSEAQKNNCTRLDLPRGINMARMKHTLSFFGAVLECDDCGDVIELRANDIRDLIRGFKETGWAGVDLTTTKHEEMTVFICAGCTKARTIEAAEGRGGLTVIPGGVRVGA